VKIFTRASAFLKELSIDNQSAKHLYSEELENFID